MRYTLSADVDPKCMRCKKPMQITSNHETGCMDFFCQRCRKPWAKKWSKLRIWDAFKTEITCHGQAQNKIYSSLMPT